jgi:hypothetical protein
MHALFPGALFVFGLIDRTGGQSAEVVNAAHRFLPV